MIVVVVINESLNVSLHLIILSTERLLLPTMLICNRLNLTANPVLLTDNIINNNIINTSYMYPPITSNRVISKPYCWQVYNNKIWNLLMCKEKNRLRQSTFLGKNLLSLSHYCLTESVYCIFYNNKLALFQIGILANLSVVWIHRSTRLLS